MSARFIFALLAFSIVSYHSPAQAQSHCSVFAHHNIQAAWRVNVTNSTATDSIITSRETEDFFKNYKKEVDEAVYKDSSTLPFEIELARGLTLTTITPQGDYGSGIFPKYAVENSKNGKIGIVLGLPVSGHTGAENARRWSKTDKYNIRIEKEVNGGFVNEQLLTGLQSLDATTFHELNLTMEKGVNYRLSYWRDGSAGPYGYREGRFIDLVWNGH